jgi:hypothetical protein
LTDDAAPFVPLYCRVGDAPERHIGDFDPRPGGLAQLLRDAADEIDRVTTPEETHP